MISTRSESTCSEINDPAAAGDIARAVDATFANSPAETKTETEKAFQLGFITMLGNIQTVIYAVGTAIVIAIMLVSMNTMMMAARERTREMAVLKALGFTDRAVLDLVLARVADDLTPRGSARGGSGPPHLRPDRLHSRWFLSAASYVTDGTILRALGIALDPRPDQRGDSRLERLATQGGRRAPAFGIDAWRSPWNTTCATYSSERRRP